MTTFPGVFNLSHEDRRDLPEGILGKRLERERRSEPYETFWKTYQSTWH